MLLLLILSLGLLFAPVMTSSDYVTYHRGNMPLILSAPHGGSIRAATIPDRAPGCLMNGHCLYGQSCQPLDPAQCPAKLFKDSYTKEITLQIAQRIYDVTGKSPHVIINELHRTKLDANRELDEATCNVPEAVEAYGLYTLFIREARTSVGLLGDGRGLFIDVHGQTHGEEWVELGYTLTKTDLNSESYDLERSSIRALVARACADGDMTCWECLISGHMSLGRFVQGEGFDAVPSPGHPSPGSTGNYFSGGFNTKTYGSRDCGNIDAIQIELPRSVRFGTDRLESADKLADAILAFLTTHQYL